MRLHPGIITAAGALALASTLVFGQEVGKEAPALKISEARGVNPDFKLASLKGKWVIIEFWGSW